ncbi:hypothetical protein OB905_11140 [Halobacteria archaeon AArc-dxtr1]|nr:hypothetical protein [Halobacteria archaeon AArc-dxtr1]
MDQERYRKVAEVALVLLGFIQALYGYWHWDYVILILGHVYAIMGGSLLGLRLRVDEQ